MQNPSLTAGKVQGLMKGEKAPGRRTLIGPAGWFYRDWEGIVYPKPKPRDFDPLAYLCGYFDCIEINASFYHPPSLETVRTWARRVSGNPFFLFTVKLWKRFTHDRDPYSEREVDLFRSGIDPLVASGRLGCLLAQFPWSFKKSPANLAWVEGLLAAFGEYPMAVEVRHASWNSPDFCELLRECGAGFVNIDQPLFSRSIGPDSKVTSAIGYVRLHGRNARDWFREDAGRDERYDYLYSTEELLDWTSIIDDVRALADTVFVVTNNHFKGQAVCNALQLKNLVTGEPVDTPAPMLNHYPSLAAISADPAGAQGDLFMS